MANKTVLEIVKAVAGRIGVGKPNTATGSTDVQITQLLDLVNEEGQELAARHDWQVLVKEQTYVTLASESQGLLDGTIVASTAGFDHILNDTIWNRTTRFGPGGPLSPSTWQGYKAVAYSGGPWAQYRFRGGYLLLNPAPPAGQTLAFEYKSKNWVSNVLGDTTRDEFIADSDYPLLSDRLIRLGLMWRWKASKGLDFAQDHMNYELAVADATTRESPRTFATLDGYNAAELRPYVVAPAGNWMQ